MKRLLAGFCLLMLLAAPASAFSTVRLSLQWLPQAQFAGYYVAFEKGIYLRKGLDVFITHGGPGKDPLLDLAEGRADVATAFLSDALRLSQYHPVIQMAQLVNRSGLMLVAWKDRGIENRSDLDRRDVSLWPGLFQSSYLGFFRENDLFPHLVPQYGSVALFLRGGVDACAAMEYNEYHEVIQAGVDPEELTCFFMRDEGFGFPEDGIYCVEALFRDSPDDCRAFVEASLEGWRYVREHPEEALDLVMAYSKKAHVPTNRSHQRWMLRHLLSSIFPADGAPWKAGVLSREDFDRTVEGMISQGQLVHPPRFDRFTVDWGRNQ